MKTAINLVFATILICSSAAYGSFSDLVLRCEQRTNHNAPVTAYIVSSENYRYVVRKLQDEHEVARVTVSGSGSVTGYGGTHLFFVNAGRSGYLMVHHHQGPDGRKTALLDINLFQSEMRALNTEGPRNDFVCESY